MGLLRKELLIILSCILLVNRIHGKVGKDSDEILGMDADSNDKKDVKDEKVDEIKGMDEVDSDAVLGNGKDEFGGQSNCRTIENDVHTPLMYLHGENLIVENLPVIGNQTIKAAWVTREDIHNEACEVSKNPENWMGFKAFIENSNHSVTAAVTTGFSEDVLIFEKTDKMKLTDCENMYYSLIVSTDLTDETKYFLAYDNYATNIACLTFQKDNLANSSVYDIVGIRNSRNNAIYFTTETPQTSSGNLIQTHDSEELKKWFPSVSDAKLNKLVNNDPESKVVDISNLKIDSYIYIVMDKSRGSMSYQTISLGQRSTMSNPLLGGSGNSKLGKDSYDSATIFWMILAIISLSFIGVVGAYSILATRKMKQQLAHQEPGKIKTKIRADTMR